MDTLYKNAILNNIVSLCKERSPKVSPSKMCVDLGMSKSLITKLKEKPDRSINGDTAQKIADYFGVTVDRVLGSEQKENPTVKDGEVKKLTPDNYKVAYKDMTTAELYELLADITKELQGRDSNET